MLLQNFMTSHVLDNTHLPQKISCKGEPGYLNKVISAQKSVNEIV